MPHWLLKSEPAEFSWDDLRNAPNRTTSWDGVRNYAARNFLRAMKLGELAFFYHSSAEPNAIVGIVEVVREAYADETQFDRKGEYFEKRATRAEPVWSTVDIRAREAMPRPVTLAELRGVPGLEKMELLRRGSRLSVTPVTDGEWAAVRALVGLSAG
jgi:predicted RNA-binding protein with PUA-like domain